MVGCGEFSAKEKLRDVAVDGGEFNIICQNALSSSAISLKYEKNVIHIIVIYIASEIISFAKGSFANEL